MMGIITKFEAWLQGKKAYILVFGAIVASIVSYVNGTIDLSALIQQLWVALTAGALRSGITKSGTGV